jgi:bacillithiol system protein YtxJ
MPPFFRKASVSSDDAIPELRSIADCEKLFENTLAILFKHSTSCATSRSAHKEVLRFCKLRPEAQVWLLLVLESRDLCQYIAERFAVKHKSPQVLVIRDKQLVVAVSHEEITAQFLLDSIR